MGKFLHVASRGKLNKEGQLKLMAQRLIMQCIYLMMLESQPDCKLAAELKLTRMIRTHVLGIGATGSRKMQPDNVLWEKIARTMRTARRPDVCNVQSPLLEDIPYLEYLDGSMPEGLMHQSELGKALKGLATATVDPLEESDETQQGVIDYGMLSIEHLGSIFERLLELSLEVETTARGCSHDRIKTVERGGREIETAGKSKGPKKKEDTARREHGAYFTHPTLVAHLAGDALLPVLDDIAARCTDWPTFRVELCNLRIVDPTMGSGHFLVGASRLLRDALDNAARHHGESKQAVEEAFAEAVDTCLYGVDLNVTSVEIAKFAVGMLVSPDKPTMGLNMHFRSGDSLWGCARVADLRAELDQRASSSASSPARDGELERRVCDAIWPSANTFPADMAIVRKRLEAVDLGPDGHWPLNGGETEEGTWRQTKAYRILKQVADRRVGAVKAKADEQAHVHFHWCVEFPCLFSAGAARFDCVVGNPPWLGVTTKDVTIRSQLYQPLKAFLSREGKRKEGRMFTRSEESQQMYGDLFAERCFHLTRDKDGDGGGDGDGGASSSARSSADGGRLALVLPSAFLTSARSKAARGLLQGGGCSFRSVHDFGRGAAKAFFGIDLPGICTILAAKGGTPPPCSFFTSCTQDDLQGTKENLPAASICKDNGWRLAKQDGPLSKLREIRTPLVEGKFDRKGGIRVRSSTGEVMLTTSRDPGGGRNFLLRGSNIAGAYLLSKSPVFQRETDRLYYLPTDLKGNRQDDCSTKRIAVKHVVDATDSHKAQAAILDVGVNGDDSIQQLIPKDEDFEERDLNWYLAVFNSFVVDAMVRHNEGSSSNISLKKYVRMPLPDVVLPRPWPTVDQTTQSTWQDFVATADLDRCDLLHVSDNLFTRAEQTDKALLILVIEHGAAYQGRKRLEWLETMPDDAQKTAAHNWLRPHRWASEVLDEVPSDKSDVCDKLRRAQVVLNHLVAYCYGLNAAELRELHVYIQSWCERRKGKADTSAARQTKGKAGTSAARKARPSNAAGKRRADDDLNPRAVVPRMGDVLEEDP